MKKKKNIVIFLICLIIVIGVIIYCNFRSRESTQEVSVSVAETSKNEVVENYVHNTISNNENNISNNLSEGEETGVESNTVVKKPDTQKNNSINNNDNQEQVIEEPKQNVSNSKVDNVSNKNTTPTGNTKYYIKVNYQANAVTIYEKDDNNYYTVPVKAMVCSCGTATPKSGVYKTSKGYEWGYLEGGTFGRYSTRIIGGILFHSVPYISQSEDSLEYWEYDKLGTTASLGCVRLSVADCKWIFDNCEVGTQVEFYADSNPGPLGKPSAQKISDNEECRNWDPTDTSPNSPWNN